MVSQTPQCPQGGNEGPFVHPTPNAPILMCQEKVNVTMRAESYDTPESSSSS